LKCVLSSSYNAKPFVVGSYTKKNKMANLYQKPMMVNFSLPYSDGSGERLNVLYDSRKKEIEIESIDKISIAKEDLEWLIDVLQDVKRLHLETLQPSK